jgi:hypothetical protein
MMFLNWESREVSGSRMGIAAGKSSHEEFRYTLAIMSIILIDLLASLR